MNTATNDQLGYVIRNLEAHRGQWAEIATGAGVPISSLKKIGYRTTPNPGVLNVQKLANYFVSKDDLERLKQKKEGKT